MTIAVRHSTYRTRKRTSDPTRTLTLRNAFASQMGRRFNKAIKLIRQAIVEDDCFGLMPGVSHRLRVMQASSPGYRAFDFPRSAAKVEAFMEWLEDMVEREILEVYGEYQIGVGIEEPWTNIYVRSAYMRGISRARDEMRMAGYEIPEELGGVGFEAIMSSPFHVDRVGLLFTRVFSGLKGITAEMDTQISRILAQGIAEGRHPYELARLLVRTITGPSGDLGITDALGRYIPARRRAKMLARTEIIRAHHVAMIQEYENFGVLGVKIMAELKTAGDLRVCPICFALEKKSESQPYTLQEIRGVIPVHPNCRCVALPVDVTDVKTKGRR